MTFSDAYDAIVAKAALPEHAARVAAMRRAFEDRTGRIEAARVGTEDFEARSRAFWDDALTRQGFAREVGGQLGPEGAGWVRGLDRAHRGLFVVGEPGERLVLSDVWGGGQFVVDELDAASRDAMHVASAPFDARLAAREDGARIALLPGALFHPAVAAEPLRAVLVAARGKGLGTDDVLDALLRMEQSLRTLSRVKPAYAYRPEVLEHPGPHR